LCPANLPTSSTLARPCCRQTRASVSSASCLTCASLCQPQLIVDVWVCRPSTSARITKHLLHIHLLHSCILCLLLPPARFLQTKSPFATPAVLQRGPLISRRASAHRGRVV
jgi:hypothetical protein